MLSFFSNPGFFRRPLVFTEPDVCKVKNIDSANCSLPTSVWSSGAIWASHPCHADLQDPSCLLLLTGPLGRHRPLPWVRVSIQDQMLVTENLSDTSREIHRTSALEHFGSSVLEETLSKPLCAGELQWDTT